MFKNLKLEFPNNKRVLKKKLEVDIIAPENKRTFINVKDFAAVPRESINHNTKMMVEHDKPNNTEITLTEKKTSLISNFRELI